MVLSLSSNCSALGVALTLLFPKATAPSASPVSCSEERLRESGCGGSTRGGASCCCEDEEACMEAERSTLGRSTREDVVEVGILLWWWGGGGGAWDDEEEVGIG